tara:strand:- start:641 stop:1225 length:585 start_codon:yes stop_codon:yes gene_type:complete
MNKKTMTAALIAATVAGTAHAQSLEDLLVIDLSVTNQVTISSTGGLSAVSASGSDTTGVYFDNFYGGSGDSLSASFVSGDITNAENPSDGSPSLFRGGAGSDSGLNMWSWSSDFTVTFTAGSQAFIGSATWDLDANEYADMLAGNSSGVIYFPADTADDVAGAVALGTYSVIVPAPAGFAVMGLGGLVAARRRR